MNWLYRYLNVADHEIARVNYMWGLQFLWQVGLVFAWTVVTALFLDMFGIENVLYLFLADAWLLILGSFLAHFCFLRIPLRQFFYANIAAVLAFLSIAWIYQHEVAVFFTSLILAKDLFFSQIRIAILRKNEELMSPTEATHLMPVVETALTIGTIVGAGAFLWLLQFFSSKIVLFFWAVPVLALLGLVYFGPRYLRDIPQIHRLDESQEENNCLRWADLGKVRFLWMMGVVVMIQGVLWSVLEFEFLRSLTEYVKKDTTHFALDGAHLQANVFQEVQQLVQQSTAYMEQSLAYSLGMLELMFGVVALLVQILLVSRVLGRLGVVHTMLTYFLGLLGVVATFALGGISMNLVKGYKHGFHALFMSAYHLTFYSIFSKNREAIRHFFEGFIYPAGIIVGVGVMVMCATFSIPLAYLMVVLAAILGLLMIPMRAAFTQLSKQNLRSDQCVLTKMHSIEVLGQRGHHRACEHLSRELLRSDLHPVVREKMVVTLSKINDPKIVHTYVQILSNDEEKDTIKTSVLESLLKMGALRQYWKEHAFSQYHLLETLKTFFAQTKNKHLRKLVVMNIFAHMPTSQVVPFFLEVLENGGDELKSVCLRSAGEIFADPEVEHYIRQWLDHPKAKLRGYAIIALWNFSDQAVLRDRITALLQSDNTEELIAGIYAAGEVQDLTQEMALVDLQDHADPEVHLQTLVALAKFGNQTCLDDILHILFESDEVAAKRCFAMLKRAPKIRYPLKRAIQFEVSRRVMQILLESQVREVAHLKRLPQGTKTYLRRLYRLAEKYDELLHLE